MDILQTMGGATLAVTTVVLGASMFPQDQSQQTAAEQATSGAVMTSIIDKAVITCNQDTT